jgi:hypothetical protein
MSSSPPCRNDTDRKRYLIETAGDPAWIRTRDLQLDAWSRNDINARSDIFTVRAPFEAIAEFRFVGMLAAGWRASRPRCRSSLPPVRAPLDPRSAGAGHQNAMAFSMRDARSISGYPGCSRIVENRLGLDVLGLNRPVTALVVLDNIGQNVQLGGFWSVGAFSCRDVHKLISTSQCAIIVGLRADPQQIDVEI